jgi:hypothetical protein
MKWKKISNFILAIIFSVILAITTLLNILGPLHMNASGTVSHLGTLSIYSAIYFIFSLVLLWGLYFYLKEKTKILFFSLIVVGILLMIFENFLWAFMS